MSNELFDKKLKDRLNSVNKPVSPNVWNNIEKQLAIPWYHDFWRRFGFPTYSVLSTLVILYCIKEIFQSKEQLNLLNDKISTIQQIKVLPEIKTIVHKDTIFIQKTIYVVKKSNKDKVIKVEQSPTFVLKENKEENFVESEIVSIKSPSTPTLNFESSVDKTAIQVPTKGFLANDVNSTKEKTNLTPKEEKIIEPTKDSIKAPLEKPMEASILPVSEKKSFHWPKLDARFGVSSSISLAGDFNLGPVIELFLRPNLGFTMGIAINKYPTIEYISDKQFNFYTGQSFVELYRSKIPEKYDALTEISINTSILELPLYLNYYVPIKRNFDLKFTFGTHIDLKLYQNIRFETYNKGEEVYTEFNTLASKNSWHNMILGVGLQYKFKNLAFQLSPTYLYNYREVDYIKSGGAFRANGSILLNIGNK